MASFLSCLIPRVLPRIDAPGGRRRRWSLIPSYNRQNALVKFSLAMQHGWALETLEMPAHIEHRASAQMMRCALFLLWLLHNVLCITGITHHTIAITHASGGGPSCLLFLRPHRQCAAPSGYG